MQEISLRIQSLDGAAKRTSSVTSYISGCVCQTALREEPGSFHGSSYEQKEEPVSSRYA